MQPNVSGFHVGQGNQGNSCVHFCVARNYFSKIALRTPKPRFPLNGSGIVVAANERNDCPDNQGNHQGIGLAAIHQGKGLGSLVGPGSPGNFSKGRG